MFRGTTPTIIFTLDFVAESATKLQIAFSQDGVVKLTKGLSDVTISQKKITVQLTEAETLSLEQNKDLEMQIRMTLSGEVMASNIMTTSVDRILKDGTL